MCASTDSCLMMLYIYICQEALTTQCCLVCLNDTRCIMWFLSCTGQRKAKDGKLSGEKSKENVKTKPFFDVDEGGKGTHVGPSGDNETFKSQGRDTQGKGDTLGIGDKQGQNKGPGPGTK